MFLPVLFLAMLRFLLKKKVTAKEKRPGSHCRDEAVRKTLVESEGNCVIRVVDPAVKLIRPTTVGCASRPTRAFVQLRDVYLKL